MRHAFLWMLAALCLTPLPMTEAAQVVALNSLTGERLEVPPGLTNVVAIAAGWYHTLVLNKDGTVIAWGDNVFGATNVPVGLTNVVAIAGGEFHSLALKADGTVVGWGAVNSPLYAPVNSGQAEVPANLKDVVAIAAGGALSMAAKADGSVVEWGVRSNATAAFTNIFAVAVGGNFSAGLRGNGTVIDSYFSFGVATGPSNVVAISSQQDGPMALRNDGILVKWDGLPYDTSPGGVLSNIVAIATGQFIWAALRDNGRVTAWTVNSTPVWDKSPNLSNVVAIAAGYRHFAALLGDGSPMQARPITKRRIFTGESAGMNAGIVGQGPLQYQWFLNDAAIVGATNASVTVTNARLEDAGVYTLTASNGLGSISVTNTILNVVESAPIILVPPISSSTYPGGTAKFSVIAIGSPPLRYQWIFRGLDLFGATNEMLVVTNISFPQAGQYSVRVANALGSVATASVDLIRLSSLGHGLIDFRNHVNGLLDEPLRECGSTNRWSFPGFVADLVWSPIDTNDFKVATGDLGTVPSPSPIQYQGVAAGYWPAGIREVELPAGASVKLQVRIWDSTMAGSFEEAQAKGTPWRQSNIFTDAVGDPGFGTSAPNPSVMTGFKGASLSDCIGDKLTIITQPTDQRIGRGTSGVLSIKAALTSSAPPDFQWQHLNTAGKWQDIPGGNGAVLNFASVQVSDQGSYRVIVSGDCCGPVASQAAKVSTLVPPECANITWSNGAFFFDLRGNPGNVYSIEVSNDLFLWHAWQTFTNVVGFLTVEDVDALRGVHYYRAIAR